jgi:CubicO group peptidase (beta-lactamase class C family)
MALGYSGGKVSDSVFMDFGWESPAGQLYSTADDLAQLMYLLFRDNVAFGSREDQLIG